ncbi:MAG: IS66 family transposase [Deltaproteobacteria bacterium]|nr:IS66 family transposase [Deltaproteobacteria bacterium]
MSFCNGCLEKQQKIDQLLEENQRLKSQLRYRQRKQTDGFFGSSTPSAKKPVKANSEAEQQAKAGGAQKGHPGHGRKGIDPAHAARTIEVPLEQRCPQCGGPLLDKGWRQRSVLEIPPPHPEPILYRLQKGFCPSCRRAVQAQAPAVLPKALFGNQLTARVLAMHYLHGIPLGRISDQLTLEIGSLIEMLHRMARLFKAVLPPLVQQYRHAPVRHADETGWRTDGKNGYAWLYCTPTLSLFLFRSTRSASVPKEVLGEKPLAGVLVVDRYNGYNRVPLKLQYCYAHLLREVEDLEKEFPDDKEIAAFTATLIPSLSSAMHLRSQELSDSHYYAQAKKLQQQIVSACQKPAQHLAIRRIQDIFCDHSERLYHWVYDRRVPADNNRCERELRPTVIARKVSFGSQSEEGAKTREILMSVLHTVKKRHPQAEQHLKSVLDQLATNPKRDPFPLLFPNDTS